MLRLQYRTGGTADDLLQLRGRPAGLHLTILKYAVAAAAVFGIFWTALALFAPNLFVRIFMSPTDEILRLAPAIIRIYGLSFLLLPFNIFPTYYFQTLLKNKASFLISVARGAVINGILILVLSVTAGVRSLRFAMPVTELVTAAYASWEMVFSGRPETERFRPKR